MPQNCPQTEKVQLHVFPPTPPSKRYHKTNTEVQTYASFASALFK